MHKKILSVLIAALMLVQMIGFNGVAYAASGTWSAGSVTGLNGEGTSAVPYEISTEEELAWFASNATDMGASYVVLTENLDLSAHYWTAIEAFSGHFDGKGHTISNMIVSGTADAGTIGLFVSSSGSISNLGLENVSLDNNSFSGYISGIAGFNTGIISNCYVTGSITAKNVVNLTSVAGLVGFNTSGQIINCYSNVNITQTGGDVQYMGGIAGFSGGTVKDCFTLGAVPSGAGVSYHGAVVGRYDGTVINCYYTQGTAAVGGAGGDTADSSFTNVAKSSTLPGAEGDGTNLFKMQSFYGDDTVWSSATSWDFTNTWELDEGDSYPLLIPFVDTTGTVWTGSVSESLNGGGYDTEDPYEISSAADLAFLAQQVNLGNTDYIDKYFELTDDISLEEAEWVPIGNADYNFSGYFDGNSHTISGMHIGTDVAPNDTLQYAGLFGITDEDSGIYDVTLTGASIYSAYAESAGADENGANIGLLAGYAQGIVETCHVSGAVDCGDATNTSVFAGGLVGYYGGGEEHAYIHNSTANVAVSAGADDAGAAIGGLVGYFSDGAVYDCSSSGDVNIGTSNSAPFGAAGGFVGLTYGPIWNCFATGEVIGGDATDVGGFVGYIDLGGEIDNCYARGNIEGNDDARVGGFVGYAYEGYIQNCYATGDTTGGNDADVSGFNGEYDDASIWNCYFNEDATQYKDGEQVIPATSDRGTGMAASDMKNDDFTAMLNGNAADIDPQDEDWAEDMEFSGWIREDGTNGGYPSFSGDPVFTGFNPLSNKVEGNYDIEFSQSTETGDEFDIESGNITLTAGVTTVGAFLAGVVFDPEETEYKLFSADQLSDLMGESIADIYNNYVEAEGKSNTDTLDETTYLMAFNSNHTRFAGLFHPGFYARVFSSGCSDRYISNCRKRTGYSHLYRTGQ